jgi:sugar/nucleoside kinase (ribokinase family)
VSRLVAVADAIADVVLDVPRLPGRGGDVLADAASVVAGGSGFNVLVAATRQGVPGVLAGTHGTGPFGDLVRAALADAGVEIVHAPEPDADTGFTVAMVEPGGERTFVTSVGAEARLDAERLGRVEIVPGDAVYVSGYDLLYPVTGPAVGPWLSRLPTGCLVVTDAGPLVADVPAAVLDPVASRTDWFVCNAVEAGRLTGRSEPAAAASDIARRWARAGAVVRLGVDGCLVAVDGEVAAIAGRAVEAVDTNGAGDAHTGVLVAALLEGRSPFSAAARANAGAALAVTRRGPATAPTSAELDAFAPSTRP